MALEILQQLGSFLGSQTKIALRLSFRADVFLALYTSVAANNFGELLE